MPYIIPNLADASKTDPDYPPHCIDVGKPRREPGGMLGWTLTIEWQITENNVTRVQLPDVFSDRDRTKMLRAFEGAGPAVVLREDPMMEITADLHVAVGPERLPLLIGGAMVVKRYTLSASKGSASVRVLLLLEVSRERAPEVCDAIDTDLHIVVQQQLGLFVKQPKETGAGEGDAGGDGESGDDETPEHDLPPEAGGDDNGTPRRRRRNTQPQA